LPTATDSVLGGVKVCLSTLKIAASVLDVKNAIYEFGTVKKDGSKLSGSSGWTVSKNATGKYHLVLPTGNYVVVTAQAGVLFPTDLSDSVSAIHDTTTGYFDNDADSNVQAYGYYDSSGGFLDLQWSFYAIKV